MTGSGLISNPNLRNSSSMILRWNWKKIQNDDIFQIQNRMILHSHCLVFWKKYQNDDILQVKLLLSKKDNFTFESHHFLEKYQNDDILQVKL
uniref:Uncharacterized protein n=1 Tax=Romanomermis culicivorax TaxID=13658 RepID=A0A915K7I1_ROMCU